MPAARNEGANAPAGKLERPLARGVRTVIGCDGMFLYTPGCDCWLCQLGREVERELLAAADVPGEPPQSNRSPGKESQT